MLKKYKSKIGFVFVSAVEATKEFIDSPPKYLMDDTLNTFLQKSGNKLYLYNKLDGDSYPVEEGDHVGYNEKDELSVWDGEIFKNGFKEIR